MNIRKKDITKAIASTPASMDGANIRAMESILLGYYSPADANWAYELHAIAVNNKPMVVAARFGSIIAEGK